MEHQHVETTLYSLSSEAPAEPVDRRSGERHLTIYRVGALMIDGQRELCLIKNISEGGMMVRAYCDIGAGTPVAVELKTGQMVAGTVSWLREPNVGIAFDEPIDVIEVLSQSMEGPRPRMPRVEVFCRATIRDGAAALRVRLHDISQGGIKVETSAALTKGCDVAISLPGLETQAGVVRWTDERLAGLSFNRLLPLATLIGWLQGQRAELRAAS